MNYDLPLSDHKRSLHHRDDDRFALLHCHSSVERHRIKAKRLLQDIWPIIHLLYCEENQWSDTPGNNSVTTNLVFKRDITFSKLVSERTARTTSRDSNANCNAVMVLA